MRIRNISETNVSDMILLFYFALQNKTQNQKAYKSILLLYGFYIKKPTHSVLFLIRRIIFLLVYVFDIFRIRSLILFVLGGVEFHILGF